MPDLITWTSSDVVAFDIMQEAGNRVSAYLVQAADAAATSEAEAEAMAAFVAHRDELRSINNRDRAAIDAHTARLRDRERDLAEAHRARTRVSA